MLFQYSFLTSLSLFFFFNDTATTEIYTLSLHDALPISHIEHLTRTQRKGNEMVKHNQISNRDRGNHQHRSADAGSGAGPSPSALHQDQKDDRQERREQQRVRPEPAG